MTKNRDIFNFFYHPEHVESESALFEADDIPSPIMIGNFKTNTWSRLQGFGWPRSVSDQFIDFGKRAPRNSNYGVRERYLNSKIYWEDKIGTFEINCSRQQQQDKSDRKITTDRLEHLKFINNDWDDTEILKTEKEFNLEIFSGTLGCPKQHARKTATMDLYCNGGNRTVSMITGLAPEAKNMVEISTWPPHKMEPKYSCGIDALKAYSYPFIAISTVEDQFSEEKYTTRNGNSDLRFNDLKSCENEYVKLMLEHVSDDKSGDFLLKDFDRIEFHVVLMVFLLILCLGCLGFKVYLFSMQKYKKI